VALLVLGLPRVAAAGNGLHPRTPVEWTGAPCMTIVDRTQSAVFPLVYTIPYEDTEVTPDEVDNSRTHQFFAFCRDRHLEDILPSWITEVDLTDADAHGLGDASAVDVELEVLENAPDWADCWTRINSDAERRPITFEAAAEPVPWDTTALPAGTWVVEGYTYEPWANEWWPHPGVFKIVDDPDPAANGPAAALALDGDPTVEFGSEVTIGGCLDAMDGTVLTASWALSGFGSEPQWQVFADSVPTPSGDFQLQFEPPLETVSNTVLIKIDVEDPLGRTWTAHANAYIAVVEVVGGEENCDDGGGFVSDPCDTGDTGESGGSEGDPTDGGTTIGPPAQDEGGSCSCSTRTDFGTGLAWGLGVLLLALGSRRPSARD
jgi:uncharacterized protein (TIGR03382 family)